MLSAAPTPAIRWELRTRKISLLHLEAIGLELFTEGLELAAARRIYVTLSARQFRLSCEFWLRIHRRAADKSDGSACKQHSSDAGRQAKAVVRTGLDVPRIPESIMRTPLLAP
jgi:hypothetical protein